MGVPYTTREAVKADLDYEETARSNVQIDRAIDGASRSAEGQCRRIFAPTYDTRYFDYQSASSPQSWSLWLDEHEVIAATSLTIGGTTIPGADLLLYPQAGPPYNQIQLDRSGSDSFGGSSTPQNALGLEALYGYTNVQLDAGLLTAGLTASVTAVPVTNSAEIGVGTLLTIGTEVIQVIGRSMQDSTQNLVDDLTEDVADQLVGVTDGTAFAETEIIMVGAEKMEIMEVAGNTLVVARAQDGTALAAHATSADVYVPRMLRVRRGAQGSTAATHSISAPVTRWEVPSLLEEWVAAMAINTLLQKRAGYSRTIGSGDGEREAGGRGIKEVQDRALALYRRQLL